MPNHPTRPGLREPRLRLIAWAIAFSALVHLLFTPLAGLLGAFAWLLTPSDRDDESEVEQLRSIPITFLGYEELPTEREESEALASPASPGADPKPSAVLTPAEPEPKSPPRPVQKPAPVSPAPPKAAERGPKGHPVAMAGVVSEVVDSNANVNLLLYSERVRQHPLGERIGKLIVSFPQWSSFFESAEIDPVRDLNRILIVGPQFRRSADVVAILQHRLPQAALKAAVDRLVQRPPRGRWLSGKPLAARAHADRAERLFVFTAPDVLVVAPPHLEEQLIAAPPSQFPSSDGQEALVVHIKTPWRALIGLPFSLPESLAWLRLEVLPLADGGAELRFSGEDADARLATAHAQSLSAALNAVTNPDLGALGALVGLRTLSFIDKVQFRARGNRISGQVAVTPRQLDRLLAYAEEMLAQWTGRRDPAPATLDAAPSRPGSNPNSGASPRRPPGPAPRQR
jgi:hypothetical protein